eukprot:3573158-Amphidinium_carterae.1
MAAAPLRMQAPWQGLVDGQRSDLMWMKAVQYTQGEKVEYMSKTAQCWLPAQVQQIDDETGALQLDILPAQRWLDKQTQGLQLRPRSRPSSKQLDEFRLLLTNYEG